MCDSINKRAKGLQLIHIGSSTVQAEPSVVKSFPEPNTNMQTLYTRVGQWAVLVL